MGFLHGQPTPWPCLRLELSDGDVVVLEPFPKVVIYVVLILRLLGDFGLYLQLLSLYFVAGREHDADLQGRRWMLLGEQKQGVGGRRSRCS